MNPGNGIETLQEFNKITRSLLSFKLMNPGNGIETHFLIELNNTDGSFQINESWKRD